MKPLQCLIVDDEPFSRKILREYVEEVDFLTLAAEAENPVQANSKLIEHSIDLMFLDIQMPKLSGIDFLRSSKQLPEVIMTTAYSEYALQGFELSVLDYLLKPIGFDRFLNAVNKAFDRLRMDIELQTAPPEFFFVKCDQKLERIELADLLFVQAMANYVVFQTLHKKYVTYLTIKGVEEKLPATEFVRIHKSFLVAIRAIQSIEQDEVKLINQVRLPLSKFYKREVTERINPLLLRR